MEEVFDNFFQNRNQPWQHTKKIRIFKNAVDPFFFIIRCRSLAYADRLFSCPFSRSVRSISFPLSNPRKPPCHGDRRPGRRRLPLVPFFLPQPPQRPLLRLPRGNPCPTSLPPGRCRGWPTAVSPTPGPSHQRRHRPAPHRVSRNADTPTSHLAQPSLISSSRAVISPKSQH